MREYYKPNTMTIPEFVTKVQEMRTAQKAFFAGKGKEQAEEKKQWLILSKKLEKQVDQALPGIQSQVAIISKLSL